MKLLSPLLLAIMHFILLSCKAQKTYIKLVDVKFESIFGSTKGNSDQYCLLGSGFFRAPRADNTDSLITDWIKKHSDAYLIPISSIKDKAKLTYCWVIDNNDTLNNFLIKNGCFPGGTMMRPSKGIAEIYINDKDYATFIEQIKNSETYAKKRKLGIWIKDDPFD